MPDEYQSVPDERDTEDVTLDQPDSSTIEDWLSEHDDEIKTHQAALKALLLTQMDQQRQQLPAMAPTPPAFDRSGTPGYDFGRGVGVLQPASALPPNSPRNRMYMGPMVGAPNASPRELFDAMGTPNNTFINNAPPPQITGPAANDAGVASGLIQPPTQRLTPTDIAWTPAYQQWAAQQDMQADIDRGFAPDVALARHPEAIIQTAQTARKAAVTSPGVTPYTASYSGQQFVVNPKTGGVHPLKTDTPPVVAAHIKSLEKTVAEWDKTIAQDPKNKLVPEWQKRREEAQAEWERIYNQFAPEGARSKSSPAPVTAPGTSTATTTAAQASPPSAAPAPWPLPKTKSQMVKGKRYTAKGRVWEWDGSQLVEAQ